MRLVDDAERRARLGVRHHLAGGCRSPEVATVARDLVGLHATDPASIFLGARARTDGIAATDVERALYDDRTVLRMLAMRRTMFVFPVELAAVVQHACADAVAANEVKRLAKQLETDGVARDGAAWIADVGADVVAALAERGEATASELTKAVPLLQSKIHLAPGKSYGASVNVTSRVLTVLAAQGHVVRGRPSGSWIGTQYRWSPMAAWLGVDAPAPLPTLEARAEVVRRWLRAFGPGTEADIKWWTGWNLGDTRGAIAANEVVEVALDGGATGYLLADDAEPVAAPEPWVALLPALDPTPMGWQGRAWYLGDHRAALFDTNGNIGPTVWRDGRIVGGWTQRKDGTVVTRLLEAVPAKVSRAIDAEAASLQGWVDDVRVTWRFPTPLQRELSA
jgi:hypothetical protein